MNNKNSSETTQFASGALLLAPGGAIHRPIAINPTSVFPLKFDFSLPITNFDESSIVSIGNASTTSSSRCSSTESSTAPGKIRRGRPQQEIADGQDAHSQKKRHRRLYARQYRAQMRQKVENVKSLHDEKEQLETEVKLLRQAVATLQQEVAQKDFIISFMHLNSQINHSS
uniref:BZIP domain-containing protein n=1 Tax=Caenorhabditis tropicalis TaxID=1561998 RepID=A0A1I7UAR5_9PELO